MKLLDEHWNPQKKKKVTKQIKNTKQPSSWKLPITFGIKTGICSVWLQLQQLWLPSQPMLMRSFIVTFFFFSLLIFSVVFACFLCCLFFLLVGVFFCCQKRKRLFFSGRIKNKEGNSHQFSIYFFLIFKMDFVFTEKKFYCRKLSFEIKKKNTN